MTGRQRRRLLEIGLHRGHVVPRMVQRVQVVMTEVVTSTFMLAALPLLAQMKGI